MARKTVKYTVKEAGRDKGKLFLLTEMSSTQAEAWAIKVILALTANDVDIPEGILDAGMAAVCELGLRMIGKLKFDVAEPLLAEMFSCVQIIPDTAKTHIYRPLIEEDIEEVKTRFDLRVEVWNLHMGFLNAVAPSLTGPSARKNLAK